MLNKNYINLDKKSFIKRYGIFYGLKRALFIKNPFHFITDYETKKVLWQRKSIKKIRKYIKYKNNDPVGLKFNATNLPDNPIWIFWNKGIENAPDIVKKCYESVKKYCRGEVIVLDDNNLNDYITFPDYIIKKVENGNIPIAGYSDLLRFTLLEHYGGTWIDSTVYLTGNIDNRILEADFFALRNSMCLIENPVLYPAWFIHSKKNSEIMRQIRNVAYSYWVKEKHVIEYLLPNLIITELIHGTEYEEQIPYLNTDYSELLIRKLADKYDEKEYNWITSLTNIHKLSYKLKTDDVKDTFYEKIISNENN